MVIAISTNLLFFTKFGQQKHQRIQISYTEMVEKNIIGNTFGKKNSLSLSILE